MDPTDHPKSRYVQVPVPEELYDEVIQLIADHRRRTQQAHHNSAEQDADWDEDSLLELLDQANPKLVEMLVAIAQSPSLRLSTDEITEAADLQPGRPFGGFLSRQQAMSRSRWARDLPMWWVEATNGRNIYEMAPEDASFVRQWEEENAGDGVTPTQLAEELWGSTKGDSRSRGARDIRIAARALWGVQHRQWRFTPEQVAEIKAYLGY
jgi:hypothetical protein